MKIRNGFVSNSSSSSFIIDGNKYTCVDVAKKMYSYEDIGCETIMRNLDNLENKDTPLFIKNSDDTQILKENNKIYVSASNHYNYDLDIDEYHEEGEFHDKFENVYFYFPQYDNKYLGKHLYSWDIRKEYPQHDGWVAYCECGESTFIRIKSGEIMCAKCCRKPDGKFIKDIDRKNKLKRITK